jgi:hypothetical protein
MPLLTQDGYQFSGGQEPAMVVIDACPERQPSQYRENGHTRTGKQHHQCKARGRQFAASPEDHIISDEQRTLIEHLLRERISLRGICRAVGISLLWLLKAPATTTDVMLTPSPTGVIVHLEP